MSYVHTDQAESGCCGLPRNDLAQTREHGAVQQRQGPHREEHDRGGREGRQDYARQDGAGGAHVGEHGHRFGDGGSGERLRADLDDACAHVVGAQSDLEGFGCQGKVAAAGAAPHLCFPFFLLDSSFIAHILFRVGRPHPPGEGCQRCDCQGGKHRR